MHEAELCDFGNGLLLGLGLGGTMAGQLDWMKMFSGMGMDGCISS
jgi:hypothetical protein